MAPQVLSSVSWCQFLAPVTRPHPPRGFQADSTDISIDSECLEMEHTGTGGTAKPFLGFFAVGFFEGITKEC